MAIRYRIKEIKNNRLTGGKKCYAVTLVTSGNISTEQVAERINTMTAFSPGDVTGLFRSFVNVLVYELSIGNTVTLNGLGTFSLSAGLSKEVTGPEEVSGKDICLKRICFKPSPALKDKIKDIGFIRYEPE